MKFSGLATVVLGFCGLTGCCWTTPSAADEPPVFRVLVLTESGGIHGPFVDAAKVWLGKLAAERHFALDYLTNTAEIDDAYLAKHSLFCS